MMTEHTVLDLVGRYFEDGIGRHDLSALADVLHPRYIFHGAGLTVTGRDDRYLPMVKDYLDRQPDVGTRVHDVIFSGEYVAVHLTKTITDPPAAWRTILVYRGVPGGRLSECWYEQDWAAYRGQIRGEIPVPPVAAALPDPWHTAAGEPDECTDSAARRWIEARPGDDPSDGGSVLDVESVSIDCLVTAGPRFAFHLTRRGTYLGGIHRHGSSIGMPVSLVEAGVGTVADGEVVSAVTVADHESVRQQLRSGARR